LYTIIEVNIAYPTSTRTFLQLSRLKTGESKVRRFVTDTTIHDDYYHMIYNENDYRDDDDDDDVDYDDETVMLMMMIMII
jgi:hypothetical protein